MFRLTSLVNEGSAKLPTAFVFRCCESTTVECLYLTLTKTQVGHLLMEPDTCTILHMLFSHSPESMISPIGGFSCAAGMQPKFPFEVLF